jgi:hypothetical protein
MRGRGCGEETAGAGVRAPGSGLNCAGGRGGFAWRGTGADGGVSPAFRRAERCGPAASKGSRSLASSDSLRADNDTPNKHATEVASRFLREGMGVRV